jgi:hypothetical protein
LAPPKPSLTSLEDQLRDYLLNSQDVLTGGWGEHIGQRASALNTAEALIALSAAGIAPGDSKIKSAVKFLLSEKAELDPSNLGAWHRKTDHRGTVRLVPDIIRTSVIVSALILAGEGVQDSHVLQSMKWLISRQNNSADDSGWAYQSNQKSQILPTCFTLLTIIRTSSSAETNHWRTHVEAGLKQLTERFRNRNGSFGTGTLIAAHTIFACLVLQSARACEFNINANAEQRAIEWLLNNPDDALAPVEEQVEIDPNESANYGFIFSMEALLLRVLNDSSIASHRQTDLWLKVQRSLYGNFDEKDGGFFGQRVFSWSTAAGLYAIKLSEQHLAPIPSSPGEDPSGLKVGNAILFLVILLVGAVVYLSINRAFNPLHASIFGFLVLACLLAYGRIGERTFGQLAANLLGSGQKKDSQN